MGGPKGKGGGKRRGDDDGGGGAIGQGTHPRTYYDRQWGRMFTMLDTLTGGMQLTGLVLELLAEIHGNGESNQPPPPATPL